MTTDNRANEQLSGISGQFTNEQVEAAYQAWITFPHKRGPQNAENAIRAALEAAARAAQGAAPVLRSSGVDEDALAEVIESHVLGDPNGGTASWAWVNCSCGHRVEIAGVTREHVVALGRKHQARAVAAWLKGQGGDRG